MELSDGQIKQLLEWFVHSSEENKKWSGKRKKGIEENRKWIQPEVLQDLSDEELEKRFLDYYNSDTGHKQKLNKVNRDRIIRDKAKFRETIYYLLDEEIPIETRVSEVLKGKYRIAGFGRGIMSGFLMDFKPDKYCLWNSKTEMGFEVLGWRIRERGDSPGTEYVKVVNALQNLRQMRPDLNLTLNDVDFFLHIIAAEDEGIQRVRRIIDGEDSRAIDTSVTEVETKYWQIAPGRGARMWEDFLDNSIAAVGWDELKIDLSGKSYEELLNVYRATYPNAKEMEIKIVGSVGQWSDQANILKFA